MLSDEELSRFPNIGDTEKLWLIYIENKYPFNGDGVNKYDVFRRVYGMGYPKPEKLRDLAQSYGENVLSLRELNNMILEVARKIKNVSLASDYDIEDILRAMGIDPNTVIGPAQDMDEFGDR